jgi:hypothetical protein
MNRHAWIAAAGIFIAVACHKDKAAPPTSPSPSASLATLSFQAPQLTSVAPGKTAQMAAIARYSDGTEREVTNDASWTSSQPQIATVSKGAVTGLALGQTQIRANYQSRSVSFTIVVKPEGTFVVSGVITEPGGIRVQGATLTVVGGIGGAPYQVVSPSGSYQLFGVAGTVTMRVSKDGYLDQNLTLNVTQDQKLDLELRQIVPPVSVGGTYRMTLTISPSCSVIPDDLKTRIYTATITQDSARLTIRLSDANLPASNNTFTGTVFGSTVTFDLGSDYYLSYYGAVVQEILPQATLGVWGKVVTPASPQIISGTLVGGFTYGASRSNSVCPSNNSKVVLTPK